MNVPQDELVEILADGRFHSGSDLGLRWGVSRTAISHAINKLNLPGVEIYRVRGKGYRLGAPLILLDKASIKSQIDVVVQEKIASLEIFKNIPSTNSYMLGKELSINNGGKSLFHVCLSEMQQAGRGSRGRKWISPFGQNIYLSVATRFSSVAHGIEGLSLVCGLAALRVLNRFGVPHLGLKWPNDLLLAGKKIAGILVEITGEITGNFNVVVGIGVNLKMPHSLMGEVEQPWSSLEEYGFDIGLRNALAAKLISELVICLEEFEKSGWSHFKDEWSRHDLALGKNVELISQGGTLSGVGAGIGEDGVLRINTSSGMQSVRSGQVTLRLGREVHDPAV